MNSGDLTGLNFSKARNSLIMYFIVTQKFIFQFSFISNPFDLFCLFNCFCVTAENFFCDSRFSLS